MRLFNQIVAPGRRNHFTVQRTMKFRNLTNGCSVTAQFVGVDGGWSLVVAQQHSEERLGRLSVAVFLQKNIQHSAMLVHGTPQPVLDALDLDADFIQVPMGTPMGFPFLQFLGDGGAELIAPVTNCFVTDLDSALEQQFFNISVAEREAVIQPNGVLDDALGETVAIGLRVSRHDKPAYPNLT